MNAVGIKGLTGEFLLTPHHEQTKPITATQILYRLFSCFQRAITKLIMIYVPGASLRGTRQSDVEPEAPWHLARRSLPRLDHKYLNNTFATSKFAIIISMSRDRAFKSSKTCIAIYRPTYATYRPTHG